MKREVRRKTKTAAKRRRAAPRLRETSAIDAIRRDAELMRRALLRGDYDAWYRGRTPVKPGPTPKTPDTASNNRSASSTQPQPQMAATAGGSKRRMNASAPPYSPPSRRNRAAALTVAALLASTMTPRTDGSDSRALGLPDQAPNSVLMPDVLSSVSGNTIRGQGTSFYMIQ